MLAGAGGGDPMAALLPMLAPLLLGVQSGSMMGYLAPAYCSGATTCRSRRPTSPRCASWCRTSTRSRRRGRSSGPTCASPWRCTRSSTRPCGRCRGCASASSASPPTTCRRTRSTRRCWGAPRPYPPLRRGGAPAAGRAPRGAARRDDVAASDRAARRAAALPRGARWSTPTWCCVGSGIGSCRRSSVCTRRSPVIASSAGEATRFVEQLLGLTLERDDYDAGAAFCSGRGRAGRARPA